MVNVKDFGAIGKDASTDDTPYIQAALDASLSVYFPPGNYGVKPTPGSGNTFALALRTGHHLFGDGFASQITALTPTGPNPPNSPYYNVVTLRSGETGNLLIENLRIEGINKAFYHTDTGYIDGNGIFLISCTNIIIRNCFFTNFGDSSTNVGSAIDIGGGVQNILIAGNHITGGKGTGDASDIYLHFTSHPVGETGPGFAIIVNNFCSCAVPSATDATIVNSQGIFVNAGNASRGFLEHRRYDQLPGSNIPRKDRGGLHRWNRLERVRSTRLTVRLRRPETEYFSFSPCSS
jgi:hypothetical protein